MKAIRYLIPTERQNGGKQTVNHWCEAWLANKQSIPFILYPSGALEEEVFDCDGCVGADGVALTNCRPVFGLMPDAVADTLLADCPTGHARLATDAEMETFGDIHRPAPVRMTDEAEVIRITGKVVAGSPLTDAERQALDFTHAAPGIGKGMSVADHIADYRTRL